MEPKKANLLYAPTHEWVSRDPSNPLLVTVGISDHAQAELTDIVYVELPKLDATLTAKAPAAIVESVKAASDIYAPVSGSVVATNEKLLSEPGLINTDPFGEGWIFKIRCSAPEELEGLLRAEAYESSLK
ncbi:MAG: glycine cleavage system protein GcvH [Chthoniobacterales bacterium]|nr:glycine cleavage system protein GcvH [Chthoniobacterales bacterium]